MLRRGFIRLMSNSPRRIDWFDPCGATNDSINERRQHTRLATGQVGRKKEHLVAKRREIQPILIKDAGRWAGKVKSQPFTKSLCGGDELPCKYAGHTETISRYQGNKAPSKFEALLISHTTANQGRTMKKRGSNLTLPPATAKSCPLGTGTSLDGCIVEGKNFPEENTERSDCVSEWNQKRVFGATMESCAYLLNLTVKKKQE